MSAPRKHVTASMMAAIHDLPLLMPAPYAGARLPIAHHPSIITH